VAILLLLHCLFCESRRQHPVDTAVAMVPVADAGPGVDALPPDGNLPNMELAN